MSRSTSIPLAIGGITHSCAVCGATLDSSADINQIGINAVLCRHCTENVNRLNPAYTYLEMPRKRYIKLWQLPPRSESAYSGATSQPTFIESPAIDHGTPENVRKCYQNLSDELQEIIWYICACDHPPAYQTLELPLDPVLDTVQPHREASDDNPFVTIISHLPRPYIVDAHGVHADFSAGIRTPDELLEIFQSAVESEHTGPSQRTLMGTESDSSETSQSNQSSLDEQDTADTSEQVTFDGFT